MVRVEMLHVYRNYKINSRHNFTQHIQCLEAIHLQVMHLGQHICEIDNRYHLMRMLPCHWNDVVIKILDKTTYLAYNYLIKILMRK